MPWPERETGHSNRGGGRGRGYWKKRKPRGIGQDKGTDRSKEHGEEDNQPKSFERVNVPKHMILKRRKEA